MVGDADGLVRIAADEGGGGLREAEAREAKENWQREQLRNGAFTIDLLGLPGRDIPLTDHHNGVVE
jgi:regulator of RNase E activity RraA